MILMQDEKDGTSLAHAIDRDEDDMTLADLTSSAIEFLTKGKNNGFFLMVEGGSIDWAGHANDGASAIAEIIDFDEAIQVAYEFYKKHPKETLIVVTADHETGGLTLGIDNIYNLQLKNLAYQKTSPDRLSRAISDYRKNNRRATWEDVKEFLGEHMGFWKEIQINWEQEKALRDVYEQSFVRNRMPMAESMYSRTEPLAAAAVKVLNETALIGWSSGGHTASYVPVFAIGAKADLFQGRMDNTDIPKRIMKAAKYK
jgi:alkaline phosphatase